MDWLGFITALVKAVAGLSEYLTRRQLLDAGASKIINEGLQQTLNNLQKAKDVKSELDTNPTGDFATGVRDKYTRPDE